MWHAAVMPDSSLPRGDLQMALAGVETRGLLES
jgi:hypothetical protein